MMEELMKIQSELKAPKNLYNRIGKFAYRSAEGILEAVKPLLAETKCTLTITDDVVLIGNRFYIKAVVTLTNSEGVTVTTQAFAREDDKSSGMMSGAQMTGSSSSYARKYALNGLFCIDDVKDDDACENQPKQDHQNKKITVTMEMVKAGKCNQIIDGMARMVDSDGSISKEAKQKAWSMYAWNEDAFKEVISEAEKKAFRQELNSEDGNELGN